MEDVAESEFVGEFFKTVAALVDSGTGAIDFLTLLKLAGGYA